MRTGRCIAGATRPWSCRAIRPPIRSLITRTRFLTRFTSSYHLPTRTYSLEKRAANSKEEEPSCSFAVTITHSARWTWNRHDYFYITVTSCCLMYFLIQWRLQPALWTNPTVVHKLQNEPEKVNVLKGLNIHAKLVFWLTDCILSSSLV